MSGPPPRLTSATLVSALIRRVQGAGGHATVVRRGDATAGAILVECCERGSRTALFERCVDPDGKDGWRRVVRPDDCDSVHRDWLARRATVDPDLWVVELDIAQAERFAAETIGET